MEDDAGINWKERYFELLERVNILEAEIKELREKLNTNSKNSSTPPSQDPFRPTRSSKPTGKKAGGQPGHPGHKRVLYSANGVTKMVDLRPDVCPGCYSTEFNASSVSIECRQVIELPEIQPEVTQYNLHTFKCSNCGKHVHPGIPKEAERGFGPRLMGFVTMLTGDGGYNCYEGPKQVCLAHIDRDIEKMCERPGIDGTMGRILKHELGTIFDLWHQHKEETLSRLDLQQQAKEPIENIELSLKFVALADETSRASQTFAYDLLDRFSTLWTFLHQEGVELTNNLAERNLRPAVIWRKVSGGNQSEWGTHFTERLLTVVSTLRQRAKNVFTFMTQSFKSHLETGPTPSALS